MKDIPSISDAEWQVMGVLWERGHATAAEVVEAVAGRREWHPRTIKTMLGRLLRKGALRHRVEGNRYVYFPQVQRDACVRHISRSLIERVFEGDAVQALVHLARAGNLSDAELARLRQLLHNDKEGA